MPCTLFISDLHLDASRRRMTDTFLSFLATTARQCESLYILGDLFETWIGDDDSDPEKRRIVDGLRQCAESGVAVRIMRGNRDFLLGARFASDSACQLIEDPLVIDLYGKPTLLMHGDTLCTDDTEYQLFRSQVRNPEWQKHFLANPIAERRTIAQQLRETSREAISSKPVEIMDVNPDAVHDALRKYPADFLIHGHTHRPAMHHELINGKTIPRMVLGDWYQQGSALLCHANGDTRTIAVDLND